MNVDLRHGDCVELMRQMPDNSVDSIVTDPPYELGFMGKEWDGAGIAYSLDMWREALRVLKPGGHLLAFGGTRTYHRMACAIEDAGFEIRDSLMWIYGSGFPKSLDVSKAIDKAAGAERQIVGTTKAGIASGSHNYVGGPHPDVPVTVPATDEARRWQGWGTALKPAHEPVVVARKPLSGTVAANVLAWGTGGLNIDGCRIGTPSEVKPQVRPTTDVGGGSWSKGDHVPFHYPAGGGGRWPANVVFDEAAAAELDERTGEVKSAGRYTDSLNKPERPWSPFGGTPKTGKSRRDNRFANETGGPSRFFYVAKPSRRERNAGLDGLEDKARPVHIQQLEAKREAEGLQRVGEQTTKNNHPTVKPVALMRHLVRLVTPPGGVVLDPFAGSGTTLVAAVLEGFDAVGCEMTDEYLPIIEGRVAWAQAEAEARAEAAANPAQPTLL